MGSSFNVLHNAFLVLKPGIKKHNEADAEKRIINDKRIQCQLRNEKVHCQELEMFSHKNFLIYVSQRILPSFYVLHQLAKYFRNGTSTS